MKSTWFHEFFHPFSRKKIIIPSLGIESLFLSLGKESKFQTYSKWLVVFQNNFLPKTGIFLVVIIGICFPKWRVFLEQEFQTLGKVKKFFFLGLRPWKRIFFTFPWVWNSCSKKTAILGIINSILFLYVGFFPSKWIWYDRRTGA